MCVVSKEVHFSIDFADTNFRSFQHKGTDVPTQLQLSPREPHALAWGPSSFHTKIFRVERTRLKTVEKITESL